MSCIIAMFLHVQVFWLLHCCS